MQQNDDTHFVFSFHGAVANDRSEMITWQPTAEGYCVWGHEEFGTSSRRHIVVWVASILFLFPIQIMKHSF